MMSRSERNKKFREKNPNYSKQYHQDNREKELAYHKQYHQEHRDKILAYHKQYHQEHPENSFKSNLKRLNKLGKIYNMSAYEYAWALQSWTRVIRKNKHSCEICGSCKKLAVHHLLFKKQYPKLSLNINNGILLCHKHHMELHHGTNPNKS